MNLRGQTTSLAERVEISERWQAGQTDPQIALALQRPLATVRKWRRRQQRQGRAGLTSRMGRPRTGALGQYASELVQTLLTLRKAHPGWGPVTILVEAKKDQRFVGKPIPSRSRIAAYLKEQGLVKPYEHHQVLPEPKAEPIERPHQEWEVDAQGRIQIDGLGRVSIINIEDVVTHLMIDSLPCLHTSHANTQDYQLILRRAFVQYGLPEQISLDHDSVFYDNQISSPFPTLLPLWLIGLGIGVRFIHRAPPADHALIERAHQTLTQQAVTGQTFWASASLQAMLTGRIHFLNWDYPSRSLQGQPPMKAYPQAASPIRPFRLEWENEMLDLHRIYDYLAQGRWFRLTGPVGMFALGAQRYNARTRFAHQTLEITFDPLSRQFVCLPETSPVSFRLAAKGLTKEALIGELDPLISIPAYQLALPFSRQAWREMSLCQSLTGTTL
jgi:hypothetical protein